MDLTSKKCVPCEGGTPPLDAIAVTKFMVELKSGWAAYGQSPVTGAGAMKLKKEFKFPDFKSALAFANRVGDIAESEGHHPDITVSYGKVAVELFTHAVQGLTENDFIVAAKVDKLNI